MATKKPLVITNGQLEQLQPGDRIDVGNRVGRTADAALAVGQPVYASSASNVDLAQADAQGTIRIKGLAAEAIAAAASGEILVDGIMTATTGEWDAVTGETGGLTPGADYFLDAGTAGMMTQTAPTTAGEFVVRVGHALSDTEFEIEVQQPIKL